MAIKNLPRGAIKGISHELHLWLMDLQSDLGSVGTGPSYLVLASDSSVEKARVITTGHGLGDTDGGAGGTFEIFAIESELDHALLGNKNSSKYTHLTAANHADLTDAGATALHKHDHNAQDNLAVGDVHTQYPLSAGRAGGQTVKGGTAPTDDLTLQATAGVGASGSDIIFLVGDNGATEAMRILFDGKVGIGKVAPAVALDITGAMRVSSSIKSTGTGGVGYLTGAGGAVTQITSKATAVTLNKICGTITMHNATLAAGAIVTFVVNNTTMAATDVVIINHDSVGTLGAYLIVPNTPAAESFQISVHNVTTGDLSEAIKLRFAIIKAVAS